MKQMSSAEAFRLARQYHQKGDLAKAAQVYAAVLEVDPLHAEANHNTGLIYAVRGMPDDAIAYMKRSVELDKTNAEFHNNLGEMYRKTRQTELAEFHLTAAVELKPGYSEAFSNLGLLFKDKGDINNAKLCFSESLAANPRNIAALINTGNLFRSEKEYDDAMECYLAALELSPENPTALAGAGITCYSKGDYNTAAKYYSKLVTIKPELTADKVNLALITLRNKDFRKGFQLYEARFSHLDTLEGEYDNLWRGTDLTGKTLYIYSEKQGLSGLGDTILFSRYLKELEKYSASKIIYKVQPELAELLSVNLPEEIEVATDSPEGFDTHIPLLSLPMVLNARAKTIPHADGYIKADTKKSAEKAELMKSGKKNIGITFQTSRDHINYRERSIPQEAFRSLYEDDTVQLYYISKEEPEQPLDPSVIDMREHITDFTDTAALVENLEMVISADTSVVHLAGAMNKKTCLLINHLHDWRWFNAKPGKQSEWYSSVTFYIKEQSAEWSEVIKSIEIQ